MGTYRLPFETLDLAEVVVFLTGLVVFFAAGLAFGFGVAVLAAGLVVFLAAGFFGSLFLAGDAVSGFGRLSGTSLYFSTSHWLSALTSLREARKSLAQLSNLRSISSAVR